jgi:hypothetical protein
VHDFFFVAKLVGDFDIHLTKVGGLITMGYVRKVNNAFKASP